MIISENPLDAYQNGDDITTSSIKASFTNQFPIHFVYFGPGNWKCYLFGGCEGNCMIYYPTKKSTPNWFWRKMQYLILGNKWEKIK